MTLFLIPSAVFLILRAVFLILKAFSNPRGGVTNPRNTVRVRVNGNILYVMASVAMDSCHTFF